MNTPAVMNLRKNASDDSIKIAQDTLTAESKSALDSQENTVRYLHLGGICRWGVMAGEYWAWGYSANEIRSSLCGQAEYAESR